MRLGVVRLNGLASAGFEINFCAQLPQGQPQDMFWLPHTNFGLPHSSSPPKKK